MTVAIALSLKLVLPFPPGVNQMYTNLTRNAVHSASAQRHKKFGRQISEPYAKWKKAAADVLWQTKIIRFSGPVTIAILLRDSGSYDPDGKIKPVLDFLVNHTIIKDDDRSIVRDVRATLGPIDSCEVEITSA